jgi:hypothetical protein
MPQVSRWAERGRDDLSYKVSFATVGAIIIFVSADSKQL